MCAGPTDIGIRQNYYVITDIYKNISAATDPSFKMDFNEFKRLANEYDSAVYL